MRPSRTLLLAASLSLLVACGDAAEPAAGTEKAPASEAAAAPVAEATPEAAPESPITPTTGAMALASGGSSLAFTARKNEEADVVGKLTALSGSLTVPGGDLSKASGNIEIAWVGGIDSGDAARDASLTTVFFGAFDATTPKGAVSLNSLDMENPRLEVGQSSAGWAFVDVGAGMSMTGVAVVVNITRDAANKYSVALPDGAEVSIDKLGMGERKAALMTVCNHKSVGDGIKIAGSFVFGQ